LESNVAGMLSCFLGQPPDLFWVGAIDAKTFVCLTAELSSLLNQRDRQGVWILVDHLDEMDRWDNHVLGYEAETTLERQEHLSSRQKLWLLWQSVCSDLVCRSFSFSIAQGI
jgi:hypothetical protein